MKLVKGKKAASPKGMEHNVKDMGKAGSSMKTAKPASSSKTSSATKTATSTKTSTDAYTQGNITVTGGAGKGATNVKIGSQGGATKKMKANGKK